MVGIQKLFSGHVLRKGEILNNAKCTQLIITVVEADFHINQISAL